MEEKKEKSIQEKMYDQSRITNILLLIIAIILLFLYLKPCCKTQSCCSVEVSKKEESASPVTIKVAKKKIETQKK